MATFPEFATGWPPLRILTHSKELVYRLLGRFRSWMPTEDERMIELIRPDRLPCGAEPIVKPMNWGWAINRVRYKSEK